MMSDLKESEQCLDVAEIRKEENLSAFGEIERVLVTLTVQKTPFCTGSKEKPGYSEERSKRGVRR